MTSAPSLEGAAEADVARILDSWFAEDHYDDNPAYSWDAGDRS